MANFYLPCYYPSGVFCYDQIAPLVSISQEVFQHMARNWFSKAAAVLLTVGILAGCGGAPKDQTPAPGGGAAPAKKYMVAMATDVGGLNDDSFNASAWEGMKKLEADGLTVKAVESKRQEDYETNFRTLMDQGYNLIWGIGFLMQDGVDKMAKGNPKQNFAIIDAVVEQPNVASVTFKENEGSFLMGVIAAKTTKTKKVGFVGGMDIPVIHNFDGGFAAGVKAVDPTIEVLRVYSGSFIDSAKGKDIALTMYRQGADVIFHAAGATGQGVIEAAAEQKKFAIGVDRDQNYLAPEYVISSMMKRVDVAVYNVSKQAADGKFPGGQVTALGLKEDGVGYSKTTLWNKMPEGTQALVDKWADAIKAGTVTVPNHFDKVKDWTAPKL